MKKLMFALACAASAAVFAEGELSGGVVGFEGYNVPFSLGLSGKDDAGSSEGNKYWLYLGATADSTADASTVKAYGAEGNLETPSWGAQKSGEPGNNYLELSTEGGTLWRSINTLDTTDNKLKLGATQTIGTSLYIDTMVQFSPTEDTATPTITEGTDKLAIWLNVDTASNTTNLMVYANKMAVPAGEEAPQPTATAFTLQKADGSPLAIEAGAWYRLTVKALGNVLNMESYSLDFFKIYLDGVELKATEETISASALGLFNGALKAGVTTLDGYSFFASLKGAGNAVAGVDGVLQAVGFQGTGAIDALVLTETNPIAEQPTSADFTLTWGEGVSAVWYTIGEGEQTAATSGTTVTCDAGAVVKIEATAADWYVLDAASVGNLTVEGPNTTRTITATKVVETITTETTAASIGITAGAFKDTTGTALQAPVAWAQKYGLSPADLSAMTFTPGETWSTAEKAYLFNIDPTEAAVKEAEEAFKITKIEQDQKGNWVVTVSDATGFNGVVKVKGKETLGDATWVDKAPVHKFFKAFLELGK